MAEQVVTETDSEVVTTTPAEGTETPQNDLTVQTTAAGQQPTPTTYDEDFLKKLESLDPASLPQSFAEKFVPKAEFTRKTQALSEDRKRFDAERTAVFELARKALADRQGPQGPSAEETKLKELQELAAAGDTGAIMQMTDMLAEKKVAPIRTQITLTAAAQSAQNAPGVGPYVREHWNDILQTMQTDPVIAQLATANNYAAADRVMIALGLEHQVRDMMPKYEAAQKEVLALKQRLAGYERERTMSLPSSTTRAGTTNGSPGAGEPKNEYDAGLKAWLSVGGRAEDYR
jgi:hypothetical protein